MQCCHKNRYTCASTIGFIYIFSSLIVFCLYVYSYYASSNEDFHVFPTEGIVASLLALLISSVFVLAVKKKQPLLILPWLLLCVALILGSCLFTFLFYFAAGWAKASAEVLLIILFIGVCIIAIEIAIFWFSCCLYREMRKNNREDLTKKSIICYKNESTNLTTLPESSMP